MGFLLLSDHTDLQLSDRDVAVGTVEMRVHPGTGLQFDGTWGLTYVTHGLAGVGDVGRGASGGLDASGPRGRGVLSHGAR